MGLLEKKPTWYVPVRELTKTTVTAGDTKSYFMLKMYIDASAVEKFHVSTSYTVHTKPLNPKVFI